MTFDEAHEYKLEEQSKLIQDETHEVLMHRDSSYALDRYLPEIIIQLEHISTQMSRYGHEFNVPLLIEELKEY